jgi:lipoprotein-anchoring transpeptidase ErfK/SrfK
MRSFQKFALIVLTLVASSGLAHALVRIDVDLAAQRMHVATGDGETYDWAISSGRAGHLTPQGNFRAQRLFPLVYSAKYNNAPMPHSIFFYGQFAIHATNAVGALGRQASHGCIRLAPGAAATLYAKVQAEGAAISIHGEASDNRRVVAERRHERHGAFALGYAPHRHTRTLQEWVHDPIGDE